MEVKRSVIIIIFLIWCHTFLY